MSADPPEPTDGREAVDPPAPTPRWARLRRGLRWVGRWLRRLLLGVCLLVVGAVAFVGGTEAGTAWAVRLGLAQYAWLIPGDARLGAVSGTLFDRLVLQDLVLADRAGEPRVQVGRLSLDWVPWAALAGDLPVRLTVDGVRVALGAEGDGSALADLAPPPSESPPPPPDGGPPSAPLAVEAWLTLTDVQVTVPDGPPLVALPALTVRLTAEGLAAAVGVHRLAVRAAGHAVRDLRLAAAWDGAQATVQDLWVDTDLGVARAAGVRVSPDQQTGTLTFEARAWADGLAPLLAAQGLGPLPADPTVRLVGGGGPLAFGLRAEVQVGEALALTADLTGALLPRLQVELAVDLGGVDPAALGLGTAGGYAGGLRAQVTAPPMPLAALPSMPLTALTATVHASCPGCDVPGVGAVEAAVDGELTAGRGTLAVEASALGLHATVEARLADALDPERSPVWAEWRVTARSVARAARLAGVAAQGRLRTEGACQGSLEALLCRGSVGVGAVAAQGITLEAAQVRFEVAPLATPPRFDTQISLTALQVPGAPHALGGRLTAVGTPLSVALTADLTHGPDRLSTALTVAPGPPLTVELARLSGRAQGVPLRLTRPASVRVAAGGAVSVARLRLAALGATVAVDGRFVAAGSSDLRVVLSHLDLARLAPWVPAPSLAGELGLTARLRGPLRAPRVTLGVTGAGLGLDGHRLGDLALSASLTPQQLEARLDLRDGEARHLTVDAAVPVSANLATGQVAPRLDALGEITWAGAGLSSAWLGPLAALPPDVMFDLETSGRVAGRRGRWAASAAVSGRAGAGGMAPATFTLGIEAEPTVQRVRLDAQVTPPGAKGDPVPVHVAAETGLDLEALMARGAPDLAAPVTATVQIPPVALAGLNPLLPSSLYGLAGQLSADVQVQGTLAEPMLGGGITLSGGSVTVLPLGQRLTGLAAGIRLEGRAVILDELVFKAADGRGRLTGRAALAPDGGITGAFALTLRSLPVVAPGAPPLRVSTRVGVSVAVPAEGAQTVDVTLRGTDVELVELAGGGPRPIPESAHIVYVDAAGLAATAEAEAQAAAIEAPSAPPRATDLQLTLADPVRIHGRILDMAWGGQISAHLGAEPVIEGALVAQGGFVELLSNRFELKAGQVTLARGASPVPFIRLEAAVQTAEALVTAQISGNATAPSLTFSAEPALEESEILTLLVTGSTTPSDEARQTVGEQAGALFASFSSPRFERALQDKLGVDRVRLTFGEGGLETPVLSFGKHVTSRLYVEARYRPNPTEGENESELSAQLRLQRRWTLESRYGDLGLGDVGVYWEVPLPRDRAPEPGPPAAGAE